MKTTLLAAMLSFAAAATAATQSPYSGEASNDIKALSPGEVDGLLRGDGLGFAKAAELNRYPGPRHVLDLAGPLRLSDRQLAQTNEIFEAMRAKAIELGTRLVEYERELDRLFASSRVSAAELDAMLLKIGETRARLRGVHLNAHLEMKEILSHHQVVMYDRLRGYANGSGNHEHGH